MHSQVVVGVLEAQVGANVYGPSDFDVSWPECAITIKDEVDMLETHFRLAERKVGKRLEFMGHKFQQHEFQNPMKDAAQQMTGDNDKVFAFRAPRG